MKCNPGFDGGMEQYFIVTVVDRMENVVYYNETTKVPDVHVNKLKEGTSYLTTITPANNKGVGTSSYIIVDTLQQPAVELTQAEEANRNDDKASLNTIATASETDENIPDGEWAVLTGTLFGTLGCFTILLVASLVIRFCVCPSMQHHGNGPADWQKADLSASGENPDTYDEPGAENTLIRKGILKRARSNDGIMDEDVAYDAELEFMNRIAQENFPGIQKKPIEINLAFLSLLSLFIMLQRIASHAIRMMIPCQTRQTCSGIQTLSNTFIIEMCIR